MPVEIVERVKVLLREQLQVDDKRLVPEARFVRDLHADSLDLVEIIMDMEKEFDIEIPDEDAEKITTVDDLTKYLTKRLDPPDTTGNG